MSNKLAARHKCSLTLKSPIKKTSLIDYKYPDDEQPHNFQRTLFPWIFCLGFFVHWIVLCPLIWALLYRTQFSENWPYFWPYLYWLVAFCVWLLAMLALILVWRRYRNSENKRLTTGIVKHPLNGPSYSTNVETVRPEGLHLSTSSGKYDKDDTNEHRGTSQEDSRRERIKKLAPLIIHRNMSGECKMENLGDVKIETPSEKEVTHEIDSDSLKKYLKLVTLDTPMTPETPISDEKRESNVPLSPRELFFIDLIREAEKVDGTSNVEETTEDPRLLSNEEIPNETNESSYFIADVETPIREKNEIFIEIKGRDGDASDYDTCVIDEIEKNPKLAIINEAKKLEDESSERKVKVFETS